MTSWPLTTAGARRLFAALADIWPYTRKRRALRLVLKAERICPGTIRAIIEGSLSTWRSKS